MQVVLPLAMMRRILFRKHVLNLPLLQPIVTVWRLFTVKLVPISLKILLSSDLKDTSLVRFCWKAHVEALLMGQGNCDDSYINQSFLHRALKYASSKCIKILLFVSNVPHCFFNLGLKRRVCSALSTTLGRWMGFLCSRRRLLVDPFSLHFFRPLWLAQPGSAFCSPSSVTRGTRRTQLEWRPCWAEVEATEESRHFFW